MLTITLQGLDYFTGLFGGAFPYAKYDQVCVADHLGAMENVGCVTISEQFRPVRRRSSATSHGMLTSIQQPGGLPELLITNASGYAARACGTPGQPAPGGAPRPPLLPQIGADRPAGTASSAAVGSSPTSTPCSPHPGPAAPCGLLLAIVGAQRYTGTQRYLGADMFWVHADTATYLRWLEAARFTPAWNRFIPEGDTGHSLILARAS